MMFGKHGDLRKAELLKRAQAPKGMKKAPAPHDPNQKAGLGGLRRQPRPIKPGPMGSGVPPLA